MFSNSDKQETISTTPPTMAKIDPKKGRPVGKKRSGSDAAEDGSSQSAKVCKR